MFPNGGCPRLNHVLHVFPALRGSYFHVDFCIDFIIRSHKNQKTERISKYGLVIITVVHHTLAKVANFDFSDCLPILLG